MRLRTPYRMKCHWISTRGCGCWYESGSCTWWLALSSISSQAVGMGYCPDSFFVHCHVFSSSKITGGFHPLQASSNVIFCIEKLGPLFSTWMLQFAALGQKFVGILPFANKRLTILKIIMYFLSPTPFCWVSGQLWVPFKYLVHYKKFQTLLNNIFYLDQFSKF